MPSRQASEDTQFCGTGKDKTNTGDLVGVFVYSRLSSGQVKEGYNWTDMRYELIHNSRTG